MLHDTGAFPVNFQPVGSLPCDKTWSTVACQAPFQSSYVALVKAYVDTTNGCLESATLNEYVTEDAAASNFCTAAPNTPGLFVKVFQLRSCRDCVQTNNMVVVLIVVNIIDRARMSHVRANVFRCLVISPRSKGATPSSTHRIVRALRNLLTCFPWAVRSRPETTKALSSCSV